MSGGAIIIVATLVAGVVIATILAHRTLGNAAAVHASRAPIVVGTITIGVADRVVHTDEILAPVDRAVVAVVTT